MDRYHGRACAKINLGLNIGEKMSNGYHEIDTIFQKISIYDEIILSPDFEIVVETNVAELNNETNNAWRAAKLLSENNGTHGVKISIEKGIPISSGLGGSSADAGQVLKMLNVFWDLGLSEKKLMTYARMIGADVPFFASNFCAARGKGMGDILEPITPINAYIIVVVPPILLEKKTATMYKRFDEIKPTQKSNIERVIVAMKNNDLQELAEHAVNMFEHVLPEQMRDLIPRIEKVLREQKLDVVMMSGAGPAVFGLSHSIDIVRKAANYVKDFGCVIIGRTITGDVA